MESLALPVNLLLTEYFIDWQQYKMFGLQKSLENNYAMVQI
jgi:hypothetical protein